MHEPSLVVHRVGRAPLDLGRPLHCVFGLVFDAVTIDEALARLRRAVERRERCFLSTPNLNFAIAAQHDAAFRDSVLRSDLSVVDGATLLRFARMLRVPLPERVAGSDLFERLQSDPLDGRAPIKVYFFGGPPGIAERAAGKLNAADGGMRCVGFASPGFGSVQEMSDARTIERINASGADFVVVALGAKKGQAWIELNRERLQAPLVSHLGAVVNFVAGSVQRAPRWVQTTGFEWLWRIKEEPALWRRYFDDALALLRFSMTQVLPSMANRLRSGRVERASRIEPHRRDAVLRLALHGCFTGEALPALRRAIAEGLQAGLAVELDLRPTTAIDSGFLALALMLDAWQDEARAVVPGSMTAPALQRTAHRFGAMSLLEDRAL
ncbi:WecB/TagA/CpsF family glycosyltransferase [Methylibium sp.]|uniref:WecB/TagA/CpsF family glycosyltransferase n=1 Tax=Methylibium sp. TaxID=2067992 RepID=UPI002DB6277A|nr:WecB/TagA/CpsF family glycosyltransferase [Methylibium sp.]